MPRFAANLSMMFQEHAFEDRFAAAAAAGFGAVEFLFPYAVPADRLAQRLQAAGLEQVLFNLPPGDWDKGERGLGCLPGREADFRAALETAIGYAKALNCPRLHAMAGLVAPHDKAACTETWVGNLRHAATRAEAENLTIVLEALNTRDVPGYLYNRQSEVVRIIERVGSLRLKLQFDLYHCQIMEGDLATHIRELFPFIGHVQVAGVPGRQEPDIGEINYPYLFELLDSLGYSGWIGCEYRPRGRTEDGLAWLKPWR
ncbi:MAG: 2-oxo-tetronate isomerase [Geminicoccaceae bacterium]